MSVNMKRSFNVYIKSSKCMKILVLFLVLTTPLLGQNVDYNKIILPEGSQASEFEEKLVQLAWRNHPSNEALRREVNIASYDVRIANASWLENVRITANVNEFTLNKASDPFGRAAFYPRYNIGASITLGTFLVTPYTIKKNREIAM